MEGTSGESPSNFLFLDILPVVQNADKSATKKIRGLLGIFVLVQIFCLKTFFLLERFTIFNIIWWKQNTLFLLKKEATGLFKVWFFEKNSSKNTKALKKLKMLPDVILRFM